MTLLSNKHFKLPPGFDEARTQKFTSIVLTLIALSFFGLFAISPTLSTIARLNKEITDDETVNQKLEQKIAALNSLQQAYSRIESDVPFVLEAMPKFPLIPLFVGQVQSLAKSLNIRLAHIQTSQVDLFKEDGNPKSYYSYSFSLAGNGAYEGVLRFIEDVTNMQRVVNIETSLISKTGENLLLQLSLEGVVFYKK